MMVIKKHDLQLALICVFYAVQAEIPIKDFKHTLDCFASTVAIDQINTISPLAAKALSATQLWKNLYQYDSQQYALIQLLQELFYVHPQLHTMNPTMHTGKIAYYLTPEAIGEIIQLITFKTIKNTDQEINFQEIINRISTRIAKIFESEKIKQFFAHPLHQQTKKNLETNIKLAVKKTIDVNNQTDFNTIAQSHINQLKLALQLPATTENDDVLKNAFEQRTKKDIKKIIDQLHTQYINNKTTVDVASGLINIVKQEAEKFAQIIVDAALQEHLSYTPGLTQQALLSFLCLKYSTRYDLAAYFNELDSKLFQRAFDPQQKEYTQEEYAQIKKAIKTTDLFNNLINYEHALWAPLAAETFESTLPIPREFGEAFYADKQFNKQYQFSDCFETALLNLLAVLFKNPDLNFFDNNHIKRIAKSEDIKTFFTTFNNPDSLKTITAHNQWVTLVANIPKVIYVRALDNKGIMKKIDAGATTNDGFSAVFEINSSLTNLIHVLRSLFELKNFENFMQQSTITIQGNEILKEQKPADQMIKNAIIKHILSDLLSSGKSINEVDLASNDNSFDFGIAIGKKIFTYSYNIQLCKHAVLKQTFTGNFSLYERNATKLIGKENLPFSVEMLPLLAAYIPYLSHNYLSRLDLTIYATVTDPTLIVLLAMLDIDSDSIMSLFNTIITHKSNKHTLQFIFNIAASLLKSSEAHEFDVGIALARLFIKQSNTALVSNYANYFEQLILNPENYPTLKSIGFFAKTILTDTAQQKNLLEQLHTIASKLYLNDETRNYSLQLFMALIWSGHKPAEKQFLSYLADKQFNLSGNSIDLAKKLILYICIHNYDISLLNQYIPYFRLIALHTLDKPDTIEIGLSLIEYAVKNNIDIFDQVIINKLATLSQPMEYILSFYSNSLKNIDNAAIKKSLISLALNYIKNLLKVSPAAKLPNRSTILKSIAELLEIIQEYKHEKNSDIDCIQTALQLIFNSKNIFEYSPKSDQSIFINNVINNLIYPAYNRSETITPSITNSIEANLQTYILDPGAHLNNARRQFFLTLDAIFFSESILKYILQLAEQTYATGNTATKTDIKKFLDKLTSGNKLLAYRPTIEQTLVKLQ